MDILIGIGGTGAKVVESVLHATAAGLGPRALHVGFIDQDRGNGNVNRAMETLATYSKARAQWRTAGNEHQLADGDLLAAEFSLIGGDRWVPHADAQITLQQILGDLKGDRRLLDLLFAPGKLEQEMELDEGYRGRAHIGSAAIASAVGRDGEPFWDTLRDLLLRGAMGGGEVRIVLAGSAFGGTGAAGFPTIARLIRRFLAKENIASKTSVAGVLMLPYFDFDPPPDATDNVARSEQLLTQTRSALRYYHALFQRETVFDEMFLVGWGERANLGYHRPGKGEQRNPALHPELLAALGACGFYDRAHKPSGRTLAIAHDQPNELAWGDLPSPVATDPDAPYRLLGRQLRFAAATKFWFPVLEKQADFWHADNESQPWYLRYGLGGIDYNKAPPGAALAPLADYLDLLIEWAAAMQFYARDRVDGLHFGLWNVEGLLRGAPAYDHPQRPFTLRTSLPEGVDKEGYGAVFSQIVSARVDSHALTGAPWLVRQLNSGTPAAGSTGLGGLLGDLYKFSVPTDLSKGR